MSWPKPGSVHAIAWFGALLCFAALIGSFFLPERSSFGFVPFFAYLPVVFFSIAREHQRTEDTIRELEKRVKALESAAKPTK